MLDRAFRTTFENLSTLFLVIAVVAVPLHLAHSYWFKEVIEVADLHDEIESFPPDRTVRDVGASDLRAYQTSLAVLAAAEVALLMLLVRPTRRVLTDAEAGRVPTATRAWRTGFSGGGGYVSALARRPGPVLAAAVIAAVIGFLAEQVGLLAAQPLGDQRAWVGLAMAQSLARSLAAPFVLVVWAMVTAEIRPSRVKEGVSDVPKLY
ncbi:MAG: hypothetical protein ACLGHL_01230 [Actinomycetota bacterium]